MQHENQPPKDDLDALLLAHSLGEMTDEDRSRLETMVRDDAEARERYVAYLQVEAQLHWRYSQASKADSQEFVVRSESSPGRPAKPQRFLWWAGVAVCAAAILVATFWLGWPDDVAENPDPPKDKPVPQLVDDGTQPTLPAHTVPNSPARQVASRYATPIELDGWRILPTKESDYKVDGHRFLLNDGAVYVASLSGVPIDRRFQIETPVGQVQASGTRYFVSTEPIPPSTTLHGESEKADMSAISNVGHRTRVFVLAGVVMLTNAMGDVQGTAGEQLVATDRAVPQKLKADGNYKEALDIYRKLVVDPAHGGKNAADDIQAMVECLQQLRKQQEWDKLADTIVAAHPTDWRVLLAVAKGYRQIESWGSMVDNEFLRGNQKGGIFDTHYRDMIRAMQLMQQALPHAMNDKNAKATYDFYKEFAAVFPTGGATWQLQTLTDIKELPDYGVPFPSPDFRGVPVDDDGQPLFYHVPKSWKAAKNDGERWRWLLDRMAKADPERTGEARLIFADFLQSQFGVQELDRRLHFTPEGQVKPGPYNVHTLKDNETLARLPDGPKRMTLPDEFDFIRIYKEIVASAPEDTTAPLKDVSYRLYRGNWNRLPNFGELEPVEEGKLTAPINVGHIEPADRFAVVYKGTLVVPADGTYTFSIDSDDGSLLRVGDDFELRLDGLHGHGNPKTGKCKLKRGEYPVRVEFFENGGEENLIIFWKGPGIKGKQYWTASRETTPPETAMERLTQIYTNRMQLGKAADQWRALIKKFGPYKGFPRRRKLEQIVENWGRFTGSRKSVVGQPVKLEYIFRNGNHIDLTATKINFEQWFLDAKKYLKSNPVKPDRNLYQLDELYRRLTSKKRKRYLAKEPAAKWSVDLDPLPRHWDRRIDVEVPIKEVGAYLIEARMADGNKSRIITWVTDTMIVSSNVNKGTLYTVVDAKTGKPIANAPVEIFGHSAQEIPKWQRVRGGREQNIVTVNFAKDTDTDGSVVAKMDRDSKIFEGCGDFEWIVVTRGEKGNRFGVFGLESRLRDMDYQGSYYPTPKAYVFTDRSVYRPGQKVHFKAWARAARHDMAYVSHFAGKEFYVEIHDTKNVCLLKEKLKANEYGAIEGSFTLDGDAPLGSYHIYVYAEPYVDPFTKEKTEKLHIATDSFRVEEYKKPEFTVSVEAPKEPIALGESFEATVKANYYFGGPVTNAKVKYKVRRTARTERWLPCRRWDWFYGSGYWWHDYDYCWYPGWLDWSWSRRVRYSGSPEEIVDEGTVDLGPDGTAKIKIDTKWAKENFPQADHTYKITTEVTDQSRRTITGNGSVIAAKNPFDVCVWTNAEYYRVGETIETSFQARRADGKNVVAKGTATLYAITYDDDGKPTEKALKTWPIETKKNGRGSLKIETPRAGQFRIACELVNAKGHSQTGARLVTVVGDDQKESNFRFNDLELLLDRTEYAVGDQVRLLINTKRPDSTVFLFVRPYNGVYQAPEVIQMKGRSTIRTITVTRSDMPNFFVEAMTVVNGKLHRETRKIFVPPAKRLLNVTIEPSGKQYQPGEKAKVRIRLTDSEGKPVVGETALSVYDKSIEYIGGSHPSRDIRKHFWQWSRNHGSRHEDSLSPRFRPFYFTDEICMESVDQFRTVVPRHYRYWNGNVWYAYGWGVGARKLNYNCVGVMPCCAEPVDRYYFGDASIRTKDSDKLMYAGSLEMRKTHFFSNADFDFDIDDNYCCEKFAPFGPQEESPAVRKKFADLAYWSGSIVTDEDGTAEIEIPMPENLTTWKIVAVSLTHGTVVGQGSTEVMTTKDLLIRLQAPRFFVERDEVVLSANVHNYLEEEHDVKVKLELPGDTVTLLKGQKAEQTIHIPAGTDRRVDWRVRVVRPGKAVVRMLAKTEGASDAMEKSFPVYVHGMLKTESYSVAIAPDGESAKLTVNVPEERQPEQTHLEVRYSPSIALAMVDALPYLIGYEYKHTESTLSRFASVARVHKILIDMGVDLKAVAEKTTNLNPQEIGDAKKRAARWKVEKAANPVFDPEKAQWVVEHGLRDLARTQKGDGGWSWDPVGNSDAHTTAYVVHGLQMLQAADIPIVPDMLEKGIKWLEAYQENEAQKIANNEANPKKKPRKAHASNLDAFVAMVLANAKKPNRQMLDYLYRDRTKLSVYSLAMLGLAFDTLEQTDRRDMCLRNVKQYLVTDEENQSAYLQLPEDRCWWYWYGSDIETHAYFLKLLARVEPKGKTASGVAKYLLNNRRHGTWWNSTRDTALALEALADFLIASGEAKPDMTIELLVDGKQRKQIRITPDNLFTFDNVLHLRADQLDTGKHTIELRRKGTGPVYLNAYMTNFTTEDFITKAGLEIKVQRRYYKLVSDNKTVQDANDQTRPVRYQVEHQKRIPLKSGDRLKSGDLVEVELIIDSKNDYEHILFEDFKPAGFEPVEVRSGYVDGAKMELRDEKVAFLLHRLPRGGRTIRYQLRAEIPGTFSALPTKGTGVYATELRANSDEIKIGVTE